MAVILKPEVFGDWIEADTPLDDLKELISSWIHPDFGFHPVSKAVNSVRNNSADLIGAA
jgi:putative SOS response-associated peptidase YedK